MYNYSVIQWLFFFYFYCFFGWCFESVYVSLKSRHLTNRGFMRGPFLPLYGSGAIMMLVVSIPFQNIAFPWNLVSVYLAGCVGATVLEYVTGVVMEALFQVRYWDYSQNHFNFQGHICLGASLGWGVLTIFMTQFLHKPVEGLVLSIPGQALTIVTMVLTALLCVDFAISFKTALDLRNIMVKMEKAKEELLHLQKRLDAMIALANEEKEKRREEKAENAAVRMEDLKTGIEEKLEGIKRQTYMRPSEYLESIKEELLELKTKYMHVVTEREQISRMKDFFQREMIRSNPTMSSERFKEALEELKAKAWKKKDK